MSINGTLKQLSCSVVVCTHDRAVQLEKCLMGLKAQTFPPTEVLVVDNGSTDQRTKEISQRFGARYIWEPKIGLSRARNRGVAESKCEIIAYLDDDAYPHSDWLQNLIGVFADSAIMTAGGRTVPPECEPVAQELCALIQGTGSNMESLVVDKSHPQWLEITAFGGIGTGMNMAFRRDAFEHVPGFDTRLGLPEAAGEEQFAVFNLVDQGFKAAYAPGAVVTHPTSYTVEGLRRRYFTACSYGTAYILFLLVNLPQYRSALLRYLFQASHGVKREWRTGHSGQRVPQERERLKVLLARLKGVWRFIRARRTQEAIPVPAPATQVHFAKSSS